MEYAYEIWVLGYNDDDTVNDYERLICGTIGDEHEAKELFNFAQTIIEKPQETPLAKLVLEEVEYDNRGNGNCINVIAETEL